MCNYDASSTNPSYPSAHPQTGGWAAEQDRHNAVTAAANAEAASRSSGTYDYQSSPTYNDSGNSWSSGSSSGGSTYSGSSSSGGGSGGGYSGGGGSSSGYETEPFKLLFALSRKISIFFGLTALVGVIGLLLAWRMPIPKPADFGLVGISAGVFGLISGAGVASFLVYGIYRSREWAVAAQGFWASKFWRGFCWLSRIGGGAFTWLTATIFIGWIYTMISLSICGLYLQNQPSTMIWIFVIAVIAAVVTTIARLQIMSHYYWRDVEEQRAENARLAYQAAMAIRRSNAVAAEEKRRERVAKQAGTTNGRGGW